MCAAINFEDHAKFFQHNKGYTINVLFNNLFEYIVPSEHSV